ncbi:acyl-CoA thioester hydrolase [Evansella caseinilytica]|uniref:Acyl-CoA thioester hydrolase n=1 Tax=Evansella caseinilytica TaxID=1503961 RepID=A0A1H3TUF0_9BACI|nr:thioesterase family protein [Evansella caseinilytica]SDZ53325.1 acyl-CoA thioester hydrolase [Evansella caseinilytica]
MNTPNYIEDFTAWKQAFKHKYSVTVRFSETDAFGHLNNTNAFVYFEIGRIEFFKECGIAATWFSEKEETIPVAADLQCDFRQQVFFDENLHVCVKVAHVGTSSVDLHYMIVNGKSEVCMTGRGRIVQVSRFSGKSVPWSDRARGYLNQ